MFSKPLDFSGVAHLVADPTLDRSTCRVPCAMLTELFRPWAYALLEERGFVTTIKGARTVGLHVPLTHGAAIECSKLTDLLFATAQHDGDGWLSEAMFERDLVTRVRRAGLQGEREWIRAGLLSAALGRPPRTPNAKELEEWRQARSRARERFRATSPEPAPAEHDATNALLARSIDELELSVRTANALAGAGLRT